MAVLHSVIRGCASTEDVTVARTNASLLWGCALENGPTCISSFTGYLIKTFAGAERAAA